MKASLIQRTPVEFVIVPDDDSMQITLFGIGHEEAIMEAMDRGFTEITEWRDGRQLCTHLIPKQTLGKNE